MKLNFIGDRMIKLLYTEFFILAIFPRNYGSNRWCSFMKVKVKQYYPNKVIQNPTKWEFYRKTWFVDMRLHSPKEITTYTYHHHKVVKLKFEFTNLQLVCNKLYFAESSYYCDYIRGFVAEIIHSLTFISTLKKG